MFARNILNISLCLVRIVEPSFSFLQFVSGLSHALCLLLYRVGGIRRLQKGSSSLKYINKELTTNWPLITVRVCLVSVGRYGTSSWSSCAAVVAGSTCAGHCLGCISPPPRQHGQEKLVWWVTCIIPEDPSATRAFYRLFNLVAFTLLWILDLWEYYLPYLYSGISLFGVLLLLRKYISFTMTRAAKEAYDLPITTCVSLHSVHSLWLVPDVQCDWPASGQTAGESQTRWLHLPQLSSACELNWLMFVIFSAVGRCRRYFELHHIWGRLALQETEEWVCHHNPSPFPFSDNYIQSGLTFLFLSCVSMLSDLKVAVRRHAGSS